MSDEGTTLKDTTHELLIYKVRYIFHVIFDIFTKILTFHLPLKNNIDKIDF